MKIFFGTDYAVICGLRTDTVVKRRWTRRAKKIFKKNTWFYYIMKPEVSMFQKQRGSQDNTSSSLNMLLNHEDSFFHCRLRNRSNTDYHLSWFQLKNNIKHILKSQSHLFIKILNPLWLSPSHERENIRTQVVRKGIHLEVPGTAGKVKKISFDSSSIGYNLIKGQA